MIIPHLPSMNFRALNTNYALSLCIGIFSPVNLFFPLQISTMTSGIIFRLLQHAGQDNRSSYQLLCYLREIALLMGSPLLREKLYMVSHPYLAMMVLPVLSLCQAVDPRKDNWLSAAGPVNGLCGDFV